MIFFDIDGTLIDHASASAAASLSLFDRYPGEVPFPREGFPGAWESILTWHFNRFCRGEVSLWEQRRARIRESFGQPAMTDAEADSRYQVFIRDYQTRTRAFDDAEPCLKNLKNQRLGIISNGAREQQVAKLERAGLLSYFSVLVFSEDVGLGKPAAEIFLEACKRAEAAPADCIHVGDDLFADVGGSHQLGIQPVWLDRFGTEKAEVPARRITTLLDLSASARTAGALESRNLTDCTKNLRVPS